MGQGGQLVPGGSQSYSGGGGYFGGAYDDDIECQEEIPAANRGSRQIEMIDDVGIPEGAGIPPEEDEEEECNDEDCEYCRQYYLQQMQMQQQAEIALSNKPKVEKEETKIPVYTMDQQTSSKIIVQ